MEWLGVVDKCAGGVALTLSVLVVDVVEMENVDGGERVASVSDWVHVELVVVVLLMLVGDLGSGDGV